MQKVLTNTLSNYLFKLVLIVLNILAIPTFISEIGAAYYGVLVLASALVANFFVFDLGLLAGVTRFVAKYKAEKNTEELSKIIATSLFLAVCFGALVCGVMGVALSLGALELLKNQSAAMDDVKIIFVAAAVLSLIAWPVKVFDAGLQGLQKFVVLNLAKGMCKVVAILSAMILAMNKASLIYIFLALNLDLFILFFVLGVSLFRGLPGLSLAKRNISKKTFFVIFTFSFWIMISQIAVLIEYQLDTFIVGFFLPIGAVAAYVVIVYPFRMIQQISGLAASAIMPAVAEMQAKSDGATLEGFVYYVSRWHNALVASMALATFIFCAPFLHIWMDGQFDQYIWIAQLACIFQLLWQANAMVGQVYIGAGHSKKLGLIAACTACLNLVFSLTLVQLVGLEGVILGTVLAGFLGELLFFSFCLTDVGVSRARYLLTSICKGQLPALVCFVCVLPFFQTIQKMDSWLSLVVSFGLIVSLMISTSFLVISSKRERLQVVQFFKNLRS